MPGSVPGGGPVCGRDQSMFVELMKDVFLLTTNLGTNDVLFTMGGFLCQTCDHWEPGAHGPLCFSLAEGLR